MLRRRMKYTKELGTFSWSCADMFPTPLVEGPEPPAIVPVGCKESFKKLVKINSHEKAHKFLALQYLLCILFKKKCSQLTTKQTNAVLSPRSFCRRQFYLHNKIKDHHHCMRDSSSIHPAVYTD